MTRLSDAELAAHLVKLPDWRLMEGQLVRHYVFADFRDSMAFVNRLAAEAESHQHHPDIDIRYNRVFIMLTTHDAGGITELDTQFAAAADTFAQEQQARPASGQTSTGKGTT